MRQGKNVWIRFAGNAARIKAGDTHHWRCYVGDDLTELPVRGCVLTGVANARNVFAETDPGRDARGLVAWMRYYGDVVIDGEDIAHVTLREPPK